MGRYDLTVRATHCVKGREAEALCKAIGLPVVDNFLTVDMGCSTELPESEVDRIIPFGDYKREITLSKEELFLLKPGDYHYSPATGTTFHPSIRSVWDNAKMVALYDRVMEHRNRTAGPSIQIKYYRRGSSLPIFIDVPNDVVEIRLPATNERGPLTINVNTDAVIIDDDKGRVAMYEHNEAIAETQAERAAGY